MMKTLPPGVWRGFKEGMNRQKALGLLKERWSWEGRSTSTGNLTLPWQSQESERSWLCTTPRRCLQLSKPHQLQTIDHCRSRVMSSNKCAWCLECPSTRSQLAANGPVGDSVEKRGFTLERRDGNSQVFPGAFRPSWRQLQQCP